MGNFFLPIVFENILFPFSSALFYLFVWVASLLLFLPNIFFKKNLLPVYLFPIIYFFLFGLVDLNVRGGLNYIQWLNGELQGLFFSLIMLSYFCTRRDFRGLKLTMIFTIIFVFITLFTSYIGLQSYPDASRQLAGALSARGEYELANYYRSIGIGGYDFFYGLAFAVPAFVAFFKIKGSTIQFRAGVLLFACISIFGIITSQHTTAFLFAIIGIGFAYWSKERIQASLVRLSVVLALFVIIPERIVADGLLYMAEYIGEGNIQNRLTDLSVTTYEGVGVADTHIDKRYDRIPFLLGNFFDSPLIGGGQSLGHNWWFDRLSMFGLVGTLPWVWIIWRQVRYNQTVISKGNFVYYLITIFLFIAMGLMKNMGQTRVMVFVFFVVPSLLKIKDLYYDNKVKKRYAQ